MTAMTLPQIELGRGELATFSASAEREWLVTNGLGGYAAGSVGGARTRRYHGLLVAALHPPVDRTVLVAKLDATAGYANAVVALGTNEYADGTIDPRGFERLERFRLEGLTPVWEYVIGDAVLEQRLTMVQGENTTLVSFKLLRATAPLTLTLQPFCTYRDYHGQTRGTNWTIATAELPRGCEIRAFDGTQPYRLQIDRGNFRSAPTWYWNFKQRAETARGAYVEALTRKAVKPGALAYDGNEVVGWAAVAPRAELPFARSTKIPHVDDLPVWSVWCIRVRPGHRGRGISHVLLEGATAYALELGAPAVEGYPVDNGGKKVEQTMAYVGTIGTFERAGFTRASDTTSVINGFPRVLMRLALR